MEPTAEHLQIHLKREALIIQAIQEAVALNRKLGTPIYVRRDGQIVDISDEVQDCVE